LKGLSNVVVPHLVNGGRVILDNLVNDAIESGEVERKSYQECYKDLVSRDTASILNQMDFYSVGKTEDGKSIYCYMGDMTEEERMRCAEKFDSTGDSYHSKADKFRSGQSYIDIDTMKIIVPEPISI
jgi:hypothetical protein